MPELTLSDPGAGVIDVQLEASQVRAIGDELYVTVEQETTTVKIKGIPIDENIFIRVRLEWNGGSSGPTVLSVYPAVAWEGDTYWELSQVQNYYQDFPEEWGIAHEYSTGSPVTTAPTLSHIVGTSFNEVVCTGYNHSSPQSVYRFMMRLNGVEVFPADGDQCTITVYWA